MEDTHASSETNILTVEASYRIRLPQPLCKRLSWINGDQPLTAWLLLGGPGRCRLLSAAEVERDTALQSLKVRIAEELDAGSTNALEFQGEVSVALIVRLVEVQLTHHGEIRMAMTVPAQAYCGHNATAAVREQPCGAFFLQGHIEL